MRHARHREADRLGTFDQGIEIALAFLELRVEPALSQAECRENHRLRGKPLQHAVEHQRRGREGPSSTGRHARQGCDLLG